jgi:2,3-bisphosphoglycerate-dependent phosphoglycerate mutase
VGRRAAASYDGGVSAVTTLLWVRHGEADSNRHGRFGGHSDAPLTARGVRQAEATARVITRLEPTAILSSDLVRARQTAEPIAEACRLPLGFDAGLRERSLGIFDGLGFADAEARYPELWRRMRAGDPEAIPEGGESAAAVFARVGAAIDRVIAEHAGGRVVVVSHGLALYHAFAHVCGLGCPGLGHAVFVLVDNASLSRLEHRVSDDPRPRWRIVSLNETAHLADVE